MFRKLRYNERKNKSELYRKNPIYKILYTPLWKQRGDDLSPLEVWEEANNLAYSLKQESSIDCEIRVRETFDELCEKYTIFEFEDGETRRRCYSDAEHSAMMVSLTAFLLLANTFPEAGHHPYLLICQALNDVIQDIRGFKDIYEEARSNEDENEKRGDFIEVADFIEEIANQETPLSNDQKALARKIMEDFVKENETCNLVTMKENERMLSRVNDKHEHCLQSELNLLRAEIDSAMDKQSDDNLSNIINEVLLVQAIENCQKYFWGNSAYAVVFCVCRDNYNKALRKTTFEKQIEELHYNKKRSYTCPAGTIANAFSDNPIYNEHISKWDCFSTMLRIIKLRDELLKELKL